MKEVYKSFIKFWLTLQIPVYGSLLYLYLMYFDYWTAWAITNTTFSIVMFHFHRRYIFPKSEKLNNFSQIIRKPEVPSLNINVCKTED